MVVEQVSPEVAIETEYTADLDDAAIVRDCLVGQEAAWEQLFRRYNRLIYKVPTSFGFSQLEVEEVYQEIAIEIIRCLASLEDCARLHPWIVTVARRVCIRHLRSTANFAVVDLQLLENEIERDVDTVEELLIRLEEYSLLRKALHELEPRCQRLLTELFLKEQPQTHSEVATLLQVPLGSIGPTRARCLDKLRHRVEMLLND